MTMKLSSARNANSSYPRSAGSAGVLRVLVPLVAFATPLLAYADDAGPPAPVIKTVEPAALAEVVVTAEKREATVQTTPISISALSGSDLQQQNIASVEDLAGSVPGISMRTAGPGQTEYEMRGLTSAGGSTATVGFYFNEYPLSANAVALNGRTVIDPDLFDLSRVEVLRGPQGTLYGAGSMGGTIKLVTAPPKTGQWEASTDVNVSQTESGGSTNGGGSGMLNIPIGENMALRVVGTEKYVSGWIQRVVYSPTTFPFPTTPYNSAGAPSTCTYYYCERGDILSATPSKTIKGSNIERYTSARAAFLLKEADKLTVQIDGLYQRIDADGYNNYQATSNNPNPYPFSPGLYQPYDVQEPYYDQFKLIGMNAVYDFGPVTLTAVPAYWERFVYQSTDSTEALQNIQNFVSFPQGSLYVETDPTWQSSLEMRLASKPGGKFIWQTGVYGADLHSGYITYNQSLAYVNTLSCGAPDPSNPLGGHCPAGSQYNPTSLYRYPNASLPQYPNPQAANPLGIMFNDNNPNVMKQWAVFGEATYSILDDLKVTAGVRYFKYRIYNNAHQAGLGTASGNQDPTILYTQESGNATLPKLNLSYEPTPDLTIYSTVARGSRPGGVNLPIPIPTTQQLKANPNQYNCGIPTDTQLNGGPIPPGTSYVTSQPEFGPDYVWSYELGEKARFADRRFTVNADVYYIKWTDIQQVVSLSCGYPYSTNAGDARAYGPEIETSARVTDSLTFNASYAYTNARINDPNAAAQASGFYPGIPIINVPKYNAIAAVEYVRPINGSMNGMARVSGTLVGPVNDQSYYRETLPSHTLVDMRSGVTTDKWGLYLTGTNLTNKTAALTINNTVFAWQQPTITRVSTNQPRTIGLDFNYKFW